MTMASRHQMAELILSLKTGQLSYETALRMASSAEAVERFVSGANAHGKCAELISVGVRNSLNDPTSPRSVVNAPCVPSNFVRAHINPDTTSARELIYEVRTSNTRHIFVPGAQVKIGSGSYVARSLMSHANDPRYSKVCDIDSQFVCADGSPRVAPGAFTKGQAAALRKAGFRFVGIENLEIDARRMHAGFQGIRKRELVTRQQELLIVASYAPIEVAKRVGIASGLTIITVAVGESYRQYAHFRRNIDTGTEKSTPSARRKFAQEAAKSVATQAAIAGAIVAIGPVVEAGAFYAAKNYMPARKAQLAATIVVAAGYASNDIVEEWTAYKSGRATAAGATICASVKTLANALPIVLQAFSGRAGATAGTIVSGGIKWGLRSVRKIAWR